MDEDAALVILAEDSSRSQELSLGDEDGRFDFDQWQEEQEEEEFNCDLLEACAPPLPVMPQTLERHEDDMEPLFADLAVVKESDEASEEAPPRPPPPRKRRLRALDRDTTRVSSSSPPRRKRLDKLGETLVVSSAAKTHSEVRSEALSGLDLGKLAAVPKQRSNAPLGWTKEEDDVLRRCFDTETGKREVQWKQVAELLGRTHVQCAARWRSIQPEIVMGRWNEEEDVRLRELVRTYGEHRWRAIGALMRTRTGKQCRERWLNALAPDINATPWTAEEMRRLVHEVAKRGRVWATLERECFQGRTANCIKNKWYTLCGRLKNEAKREVGKEKENVIDVWCKRRRS